MSRPNRWEGNAAVPIQLEDPSRSSVSAHLALLRQKAQQKRDSAKNAKSAELDLAERERGFQTYLSGANQERIETEKERRASSKHRSAQRVKKKT